MFALNCIELFIILAFAVIGCTRISALPSLFGISVGIMSSVIGIKSLCNSCSNWKVKANNQEKE